MAVCISQMQRPGFPFSKREVDGHCIFPFFCQDDEPFISNWFAVILIGTRMVIIVTNLMRISMLDFFLPFFVVLDLYVD